MPSLEYIAVIETRDGAFSLYFPDLPGCTSAGHSLDDALANGTRALSIYLGALAARDIAAPAPSSPKMVAATLPSLSVREQLSEWSVQLRPVAVAERVGEAV